MKLAFAIAPVLFAGVANAETIIISATHQNPAKISVGFYDSGFSHEDKTFCYYGDVQGVCPQVHAAEAAMNRNYSEGDHDNMIVKECRILENSVVNLNYSLPTDYDRGQAPLEVETSISPCLH